MINVKITNVSLTFKDHGILTFYITVEGSGVGCNIGGYALDHWSEEKNTRVGSGIGLDCMRNIMETVGVESWEDLKGKYARIDSDWDNRVTKIGNILDDKWFDIDEFFKLNK